MSSVRFQRATSDDLDAIAAMHLESWRAAYAELLPSAAIKKRARLAYFQRDWKKMLQTCEVFIARSGKALQGACAIGDCGDTDLRELVDCREVYSIFVVPQHQRTGIGTGLLTALLSHATYAKLYAWTVVGNRPAAAFFQASGFVSEPSTEKDFPFMNTPLRVVRYRLNVRKVRRA